MLPNFTFPVHKTVSLKKQLRSDSSLLFFVTQPLPAGPSQWFGLLTIHWQSVSLGPQQSQIDTLQPSSHGTTMEEGSDSAFKCPACPSSFRRAEHLKRHASTRMSQIERTETARNPARYRKSLTTTPDEAERPYGCPFCGSQYKRR